MSNLGKIIFDDICITACDNEISESTCQTTVVNVNVTEKFGSTVLGIRFIFILTILI